jgi:hypothetical protein
VNPGHIRHGDTIYLTPDVARIHKFGQNGLAIR